MADEQRVEIEHDDGRTYAVTVATFEKLFAPAGFRAVRWETSGQPYNGEQQEPAPPEAPEGVGGWEGAIVPEAPGTELSAAGDPEQPRSRKSKRHD